jgi:gamma-glutamyltranspeptidase/glutathione hydrolase
MRNNKDVTSAAASALAPGYGRRRTMLMACITLMAICAGSLLPAGSQTATKKAQVVAGKGMVASAHALASQAGVDIMKAGGNAIDAAVAAAFAIGVAEPNASGIGGEGMMVLYRADKKSAVAIDYRSAAPAAASYPSGIPSTGHAAVAIPGTVAGLTSALMQYGTMKLEKVMAPAIRLAEEGFVVSPTLAGVIADNFEEIMKNLPLAAVVCPGGLPLEAGAILKNPDLGRSLRKIAAGGPEVFYRGELADVITSEVAAHGGYLAKTDLAAYRAINREPVRGSYRGYTMLSSPPPVGGTSVLEILQILEHFDLAKNAPLAPQNVHLMAEAMKRGFADFSAFIADPDFVRVPLTGLLSPAYAKARAGEIRPEAISSSVTAGEPAKYESGSTTSLCAVDRKRNVVVLTQTLSDFFGAKVMIAGTGIILNNEMKNFSARGINVMAPGKRMRTTIAPTILLKNDKPFAALGTPGAARIISTMAILISNLIDHKMGIQEAIEAPRFYTRDTEKSLSVESRMPPATVDALTKLGYAIQAMGEYDLFFGGAQGIVIDAKSGRKTGGADPRRDGAVVGY